jgi:hypothetical protein
MDDRLGVCAGGSDGVVVWVVGIVEFGMMLLDAGDFFSGEREVCRSRSNRVVARADSGSSTLVGGGAPLGARAGAHSSRRRQVAMSGDSGRRDVLLWNAELDVELDLGKVNPQFEADVENQDGADGGEDDAGGMISCVFRTQEQVGHGAADQRSDDAKDDGPEEAHVHVHDRFRDNSRDQPDQQIPDQVEHRSPPLASECGRV